MGALAQNVTGPRSEPRSRPAQQLRPGPPGSSGFLRPQGRALLLAQRSLLPLFSQRKGWLTSLVNDHESTCPIREESFRRKGISSGSKALGFLESLNTRVLSVRALSP